jgi:hypothetical protein
VWQDLEVLPLLPPSPRGGGGVLTLELALPFLQHRHTCLSLAVQETPPSSLVSFCPADFWFHPENIKERFPLNFMPFLVGSR